LSSVVLGPSLLSSLVPAVGQWIVPQTEVRGYLLVVVSLLGAMFLLILTGLETDLPLIHRHAKTAAGGLILPFASGFVMALYPPDFLLADPERRLVFSLFVATAISISAVPVIAKVFIDLKLMRCDIGQTIMAAGMIDDTSAWILLSIVLERASGGVVTVGTVLGQDPGLYAAQLYARALAFKGRARLYAGPSRRPRPAAEPGGRGSLYLGRDGPGDRDRGGSGGVYRGHPFRHYAAAADRRGA